MRHHHLRHHSLCWAEQVSLLQGDSNHYGDHDSWQFFNKFNLTLSFMVLALRPYLKKIMSFVVAWYKEIQNQVSDHKIWTSRSTLTLSCGWPLFCPSVPPLSLTFSYSGQTLEDADFTFTSIKLCMKTDTCNSFSPISNLDHVFQKTLWLCQDLLWTVIFIFWYVYIWYIWYFYLLICLSLITLSWDIFIFDILIFDIFIFRYLYLLIYV